MSDIDKKRATVIDLYPHRGWKKKVDKMSDAQVIAIFLREQNKAEEKSKEEDTPDDDAINFF